MLPLLSLPFLQKVRSLSFVEVAVEGFVLEVARQHL